MHCWQQHSQIVPDARGKREFFPPFPYLSDPVGRHKNKWHDAQSQGEDLVRIQPLSRINEQDFQKDESFFISEEYSDFFRNKTVALIKV